MAVLKYNQSPETNSEHLSFVIDEATTRVDIANAIVSWYDEGRVNTVEDLQELSKRLTSVAEMGTDLPTDTLLEMADASDDQIFLIDKNNQVLWSNRQPFIVEDELELIPQDSSIFRAVGNLGLTDIGLTLDLSEKNFEEQHFSVGKFENGAYTPYLTLLRNPPQA